MLKVSAIDTSSFVNWFSFFYLNIHEDIIDVKDSYKKKCHFFNIENVAIYIVSSSWKQFIKLYSFFIDVKEIILIQISFDGNNNINPPNVMNENIFESVKRKVMWDIASYINIIYTDVYTFEDCNINRSAVRKLYSLSDKH